MSGSVKIVKVAKVGGEAPAPAAPKPVTKAPVAAARKSHKTYPKSSLKKTRKVSGVKNPAAPPPFRKGTLRILTEHGRKKREDKIRKTVRSMTDRQVKEKLTSAGMRISPNAPPELAKEILRNGQAAGMIPE